MREISPGKFGSQWKHWHPEKWKSVMIERRPLRSFTRDEIRRKQCQHYENPAKLQGALDAALLSFVPALPSGRVNASAISALGA